MSINIEQTLRDRFAAMLPDNYKRRIIFWQDPAGEFSDLVDELHLDGVIVRGRAEVAAENIRSVVRIHEIYS